MSSKTSSILIKPSHKGALHRMLGIKEDEKIPVSKLEEAAHSKDPTERKRARFALNARLFNHK